MDRHNINTIITVYMVDEAITMAFTMYNLAITGAIIGIFGAFFGGFMLYGMSLTGAPADSEYSDIFNNYNASLAATQRNNEIIKEGSTSSTVNDPALSGNSIAAVFNSASASGKILTTAMSDLKKIIPIDIVVYTLLGTITLILTAGALITLLFKGGKA